MMLVGDDTAVRPLSHACQPGQEEVSEYRSRLPKRPNCHSIEELTICAGARESAPHRHFSVMRIFHAARQAARLAMRMRCNEYAWRARVGAAKGTFACDFPAPPSPE